MNIVMLGAWAIQGIVGALLFVGWLRHGKRAAGGAVTAHVTLMLVALVFWTAFVITGSALWAWCAFVVLTAGIGFGDYMMVGRYRRLVGAARAGLGDYGPAIGAVVRGRLPAKVTFHALFSAVVYFGSLAVAIGATIAS